MTQLQHHTITGADGVALHAVEAGNPAGPPILFVHGWSQGAGVWRKQLASPLLTSRFRMVALDLRGHGESAADGAAYGDARAWAGDLAATIDALGLRGAVLAGWSYGGYVINDYLRAYGEDAIRGIVYVAAAVDMGVDVAYRQRGDGWRGVLPRRGTSEPHAFSGAPHDAGPMRTFVRNCFAGALAQADEDELLAINLRVAPAVRQALFARTVASDDVLAAIRVPVIVAHGTGDRIVDAETARHIAALVPHARLSLYADCGHALFWEAPAAFERELAGFVDVAAGALR